MQASASTVVSSRILDEALASIKEDIRIYGLRIMDAKVSKATLMSELERIERRMLYRAENLWLIPADRQRLREFVDNKQIIFTNWTSYLINNVS